MEKLEALPNVAKLSDRVYRILGLNPGKFTLQGTNNYLIGTGPRKLLLDTGEGKEGFVPLVKSTLGNSTLSDVVISHWHHDHTGGILDLWREFPDAKFHKFPSSRHDNEIIPQEFTGTMHPIKDGDKLSVEGATLKAVHTPGHADDHLVFQLEEEGAVFSADSVLGQGTAVFESLSQYMASLQKTLDLQPKRLYPGHGPVIQDGVAKIKEYLEHRQQREDQVVELLKQRKSPNGWTSRQIVEVIYKDYPESLWVAAEHGIILHLSKLHEEHKVHKQNTADGDLWQWREPSQL